ncbi:MAG: AMP-dependent synthetase/ligase [Pseudomonadota bacterium]
MPHSTAVAHPNQQAQFQAPFQASEPALPASAAAPAATVIDEAGVQSLAGLFDARLARTPHAVACRHFNRATGEWQSLGWAALDARVQAITQAMAALQLPPGSRVALMLDNGPDWVATEQAIYRLGLVSVGIYMADTAGNAAHVLCNSGSVLAFVRDAALWSAIAAEKPLPDLQHLVLTAGAESTSDARVRSLADFLAAAAPAAVGRLALPRDALASLVYTSGTTGAAKGAMLSHAALLANVFACERAFASGSDVVKLSLLPLSHSFERIAGWHHAVLVGAETAFSRGPEHLAEDLQTIRPTAMIAVPRVYERLYAKISQALLDGPLHQRALFHLAVSDTTRRFSRRITSRLVTAVQQRFGGRLRMAVSGGAPLSPEIAKAFTALGVPLVQGYGLTEAGPVVSVNRMDENCDPDSAGQLLDNVETRIAPDGELLVRSPSLMQGYWCDAEATAKVLDESGWLHTGDKASRLCGESLVLTGRLKDVLVMSTGVKACPAEIESRLTAEPLFEQAVVLGESRPYLIALLTADAAQLEALKRFIAYRPDAEGEQQLERALLQRCRARLADLAHGHQLVRVAIVPAFTLANGLVTTTLKPRRAAIAKAHAALIESLYEGHCHTYKTDCASNAEIR